MSASCGAGHGKIGVQGFAAQRAGSGRPKRIGGSDEGPWPWATRTPSPSTFLRRWHSTSGKGLRKAPRGQRQSRLPIACKFLRFGYLRGGHTASDNISVFCRFLITRQSCQVAPHVRLHIILRYPQAACIHAREVELCVAIALIGRLAIPLHRLSVVLRHTLAVVVQGAQAYCSGQ
jgi:hypothetical protein